MKTIFVENNIDYLGTQLAPHWIYRNFGISGDAVLAFTGKAEVSIDNLVDLSDAMDMAFIYSPLMLHFIIEHFDNNLEMAVYRQRMFMVGIKEELESRGMDIQRRGDDLYVDEGKLSVSIATSSLVSTLIHVGLNIETQGTPVKTSGLKELGITDIKTFAQKLMLRYKNELEEVYEARCKVRGIVLEG